MTGEQICILIGTLISIFGPFSALILWMMSRMEGRLHDDINGLSKRIDDSHARIDMMGSRLDSMGIRIDSMGARIDTTQTIIMRMLEKQGR